MSRQLLLVFLTAAALQAHADERPQEGSNPDYIGGGRYTCNEDTAACAILKQNNRRITEREIQRAERKSNRYESHSRHSNSRLEPREDNEDYDSRSNLRDPYDD